MVAAAAGPALIVAAVITMYRGYVFHDLLTSRHVDMLAYSLPNYCFLGETLGAGHIALWNPYTFGGTPFAADPLSGWMYLPAMLTFTALPCGTAMRGFIVLQPLLAGLGMYWFLRGESLSRTAATVGGLVLSLSVVGSLFGVMLVLRRRRGLAADPARRHVALPSGEVLAEAGELVRGDGVCLGSARRVVPHDRRLAGHGGARPVWGGSHYHRGSGRSARTNAIVDPRGHRCGLAPDGQPCISVATARLPASDDDRFRIRTSQQLTPDAPVSAIAQVPTWPLKLIASPGTYLGAVALTLVFAGWGSARSGTGCRSSLRSPRSGRSHTSLPSHR